MVPQTIEQCAKVKKLGTFQQRYSESMSLVGVLFLCIFFVGGAIGSIGAIAGFFGWLPLASGDSIPVWVPLIFTPLEIILTLWIWGTYLDTKERWLYVYSDGFVYDQQGHIRGYHTKEILSVDLHQIINTSNGSNSSTYNVNLENGECINIKHGAEVKARVELYQRQLRNQLR